MDTKNLSLCHSCARYCSKRAPYDRVRILCDDCLSKGVQDDVQLNELRKGVVDYLLSVGFEPLRKLKLKTCKIATLHELAQLSHSSLKEAPRALAQTQSQRIRQSRTARGNRQSREMVVREHHIYVISHLTPLECAGVLAHELLHCWQNELGLELPPELSEGLCNVASYDFYRQQGGVWAEFLMKRLVHNPNRVYGDGFREVYSVYRRLGWAGVVARCSNGELGIGNGELK